MLLDSQNIFSLNQNVLATAFSTNIIKTGPNDLPNIPLLIQAVTTFTGLTSLTVEVQTSEASNFSDAKTLCSSKLLLADLKAGARFPINFLPKGNLGYMRLKYTVEGVGTAGKITAGIIAGEDFSYQDWPTT